MKGKWMILRWLKKLELFALLMVFWLILNGAINLKLIIIGSVFSLIIIIMTYKVLFVYDDHLKSLPSLWHFLWFGAIVFISIIKSSIAHIGRIIIKECEYRTFKVKLLSSNVMINTLIANAITLTPGTISLELEGDTIEVIGFAKNDEDVKKLVDEIKRYEKPFYFKRSIK